MSTHFAVAISDYSQFARNSTRRSSAVRQVFGCSPQVLKTPADNALKAASPLPTRSKQP